MKVRAVCRGKQIKQFVEKNGIKLTSTKITEQFAELYSIMENTTNGKAMLDTYICDRNNEWYHTMGVDEEKRKNIWDFNQNCVFLHKNTRYNYEIKPYKRGS